MTDITAPSRSTAIVIEDNGGSRTWSRLIRNLKRDRVATFGLIILLVTLLCSLFPSQLAPHDPVKQNLRARFTPPAWMDGGTWDNPLGTDQLGRDLLSRLIYGARISLVIGSLAVLLSCVIGITLGLVSGFTGGILDTIIMGVTEIQLSIPYILLAISIIAILGPNYKNLIIVLALSGWTIFSKLVRAQVLSVREEVYVLSARAIGSKTPRIIFQHVLPQTISPIIVVATLEMARIILLEASLSFLGLGVQPPAISWGTILSDGREYLSTAWWVSTFSGFAIMLLVLAINSIGNLLNNVLDPTRRQL